MTAPPIEDIHQQVARLRAVGARSLVAYATDHGLFEVLGGKTTLVKYQKGVSLRDNKDVISKNIGIAVDLLREQLTFALFGAMAYTMNANTWLTVEFRAQELVLTGQVHIVS